MKKIIFVLIASVWSAFSNKTNAEEFSLQWATLIGGSSFDQGNDIKIDNEGNTISTGIFYGEVDFDWGIGSEVLTSTGSWDGFIKKLDPSGEIIWVKQIVGDLSVGCKNIDVDADDNIYVQGTFFGTVDLDPNESVYSKSSNGDLDHFILKLDKDGNFLWAKTFGSENKDSSTFTIDDEKNVYALVSYDGVFDADPSSNEYVLPEGDYSGLIKLDANGDFIWAKSYISSGFLNTGNISYDKNNFIVVSGTFTGDSDFNTSTTFSTLSNDDRDVFLLKMDLEGDVKWVKQFTGEGSNSISEIEINDDGFIYIGGNFTNEFVTDNDTFFTEDSFSDFFLAKYSPSGNELYVKVFMSPDRDGLLDMAIDPFGSIYLCGYFTGTLDFDPNEGEHIFTTNGTVSDACFMKFSSDGYYVGSRIVGTNSFDVFLGIDVDGAGTTVVTGQVDGSVDFEEEDFFLIEEGERDIITCRFSQNLSVDENIAFSKVNAFPNPTQEELTIDFQSTLEEVNIQVNNTLGQLVQEFYYESADQIQLNLTGKSGVYFVDIVAKNKKIQTFKVFKN